MNRLWWLIVNGPRIVWAVEVIVGALFIGALAAAALYLGAVGAGGP